MATVAGDGGEWEKHIDESSGSAYYYNTRSRESSWEVPAGFTSPLAESETQDKTPKWRKFVDDESGETYYYDEVSGTSRWDKPQNFVPEEESEEQDGTKETQEIEQQGDEIEAPEQESQGAKKEDKNTSDVKSDKETEDNSAAQQWVKYVDAATNEPYYFNASLGKTQWEEPEGLDEAAAVPAGPQVPREYQAHLNLVHMERLARVTQQVLDPSGNLSKLNAILSGIDSNTPSATTMDGESTADAPRTAKAEWQQHTDAQTQRYYYHNVVTGVTQWNKPDAPIVSGLANWIPPEVPESDSTGSSQKTVSGVNYVARAKFNRLTGKYEQLGGDEYWQNAGIASDRAGRQMSHFFDMTELEKNREEARRRKEQLKRKHIDWKKITAEKKAKKQKQKNEWLYTD